MKKALLLSLLLPALSSAVLAQDPPFRARLRSLWDGGSSRSDVWGEGTVGLMAHIGQARVDILDVSDPDDATYLTTWNVPSPNNLTSAQDVKAANGLMFVACQGGGPASVEIVDIRDPANPVHLTWVIVNALAQPHNIFVDSGWLFLAHGAGPEIAMVDLTGYDPDNAPAQINGADRFLGGLGAIHDITVANGTMYLCDIGAGFPTQNGSYRVYDVSDLANTPPTFLGRIEGGLVHSTWPSDDGQWSVTADEDIGGPLKLFEHVNNGGSLTLVQRDAFVNTQVGLGASMNPHNPLIFENRIYIANNAGGVAVLQLDRQSKCLELVARYDTSTVTPSTYFGEGCWGVYPYFGHEQVLASDRQSGFYVLDFSALELTFASARPLTFPTGTGNVLSVSIEELGNVTLDPLSVQLHVEINGRGTSSIPMSQARAGDWQASFPNLRCGDRVQYWVSAMDTQGETYSRPGVAPAERYEAYVSDGPVTVLFDDFEAAGGWTTAVEGTTLGGEWQRGVPVDNGLQPPFDDPDSAGSNCFVTEIGTGGTNDDVDGGPVRLISPVMDFSGFDGVISWLGWYLASDADGLQGDPFVVELSNDGGSSWTTVSSELFGGGGWKRHAFRISDHLPPTAQMRVRFSASDLEFGSTVEAGIDNFHAQRFECALTLASATSRNGTGINRTCYTSLDAPVLGQVWNAEVDLTGHPGALFTQLYLYAQPSTGPVNAYGEVLVDLGSPRYFRDSETVSANPNPHVNFIPYDVSFVGATTASQAVILGGGVELCNAVDMIVGFE